MLLGQMLFSLLVSGALASPRRVDISVVIDDNEVKNIALAPAAHKEYKSYRSKQTLLSHKERYQPTCEKQEIAFYPEEGYQGTPVETTFPLNKSCVDTNWPTTDLVGSILWYPPTEYDPKPRACRFFPAKNCTGDAGFGSVESEDYIPFPAKFLSGYCAYGSA